MIKSRKGFDRDRLQFALNELVSRHPLLRAEIADPKSFLSFIYDAGVMIVNAKRFISNPSTQPWLDLVADCIHDSWMRTAIHPQLPPYWEPLVSPGTVRVHDYDHFRREIVKRKKDIEDQWYHHQIPINATIFEMVPRESPDANNRSRDSAEYLLISIKHSFSDGNSAFPLIDELAVLYEQGKGHNLPPPSSIDPIPELERRFRDGLHVSLGNPNRVSLRTNIFYSKEIEEIGGGYYRHYLCFEPSMMSVIRQLAANSFQVSFDL
jgi:hypothetical protein